MKKFYITIIMALLPILMFSQGENDNWYFGGGAAVNFSNASSPIALTNSQMFYSLAPGSVSDKNGKLLFYTEGTKVFNREHQVMQNGFMQYTQAGSLSIVQDPANSNLYYIFMTKIIYGNPASASDPKILAYTVVDMSQGGNGLDGFPLGAVSSGLKDVIIKNDFQQTNLIPSITIIPRSDNKSFWLCTHDSNKLYSYLVDDQGVNSIPVQSTFNISIPLGNSTYSTYIKASPVLKTVNSFSNFLFITMWIGNTVSKVLSFNNVTGMLTNNYQLDISSQYPTIGEFNKDSSVLFIGRNGDSKMFAVDLISSVNSPVYQQIYNNTNANLECLGLQRNKYGDVYVAFGSYGYLSKIINPNVYGANNVDLNNINLLGKNTFYFLPNLVYTFIPQCLNDKTLATPEINNNYTHQVSDYIITKDSYAINSGQNIVMKAGNYILMQPNTFIKAGSNFLATIEACGSTVKQSSLKNENQQKVSLKIDLDQQIETNDIKLYPNPASDFLTIQSTLKVENVSAYDISGKKINVVFADNKVDVKNLPQGSYLLIVETKEGKTTKKFIKK